MCQVTCRYIFRKVQPKLCLSINTFAKTKPKWKPFLLQAYSKKTGGPLAFKNGKLYIAKKLVNLKLAAAFKKATVLKIAQVHVLQNISIPLSKKNVAITTITAFGITSFISAIWTLGKPALGTNGQPKSDRFSNLPTFLQYFFRSLSEIKYYMTIITSTSSGKLLPDQIKLADNKKYTLIIEFTDVLVHPDYNKEKGWAFKKRPGIDTFLDTVGKSYEIVLYTSEPAITVFPIVKAMDPKNLISYKLVKNSNSLQDGQRIKDLDNINRDLTRVVVIDWDSNCAGNHSDNILAIPRWHGNDDDMSLIYLAQFLLAIADNGIEDVREVIKYYNKFDDPLRAFREKQTKLVEIAEANAHKNNQDTKLNFLNT